MDKIYCGNGKAFNTQYGEILNVSLDLDKLNAEFNNYGFTTQAGKKMIKIKASKRQNPDNYGNTHSVIVDTFKPEKKNTNQQFDNIIHREVKDMQKDFKDDGVPF